MANPWDNDEVVSVTESVSSSPWEMDEVVEIGVVDLPQVNALPPDFSGVAATVDSTAPVVGRDVMADGWRPGIVRDIALGGRSTLRGIGGLVGAIGGDAFNNYIANPIERAVGLPQSGSFRDSADQLANTIGLPSPQGSRERVLGDVGEALSGTAVTMGAGGLLNAIANTGRSAQFAPVAQSRLAEMLTERPVMQSIAAAGGAGASGSVRESGGGTGQQLLAGLAGGLAPSVLPAAGMATARGVVRGSSGEQMQRNIDDFAALGAQPSVGQASGNSWVQGAESLLAGGPTSSGVMGRFAEGQADAIGSGLRSTGASLSRRSSGEDAGRAIQRGIHGPDGFTERYKNTQRQLYDAVDQYIPADAGVDLSNTRKALADINAPIEGAPNTSKLFQNGRIMGIEGALNRDLAAPTAPQQALDDALAKLDSLYASRNAAMQDSGRFSAYANDQANAAQRYYPVEGMPRFPARYTPPQANVQPGLDAADEAAGIARGRVSSAQQVEDTLGELQAAADAAGGRLPYEAIKKLRTLVGNEIDDAGLVSDLPRSKFKALYAALSRDLEGAASEAGSDALRAYRRANNYTRVGHERVDVLSRVIDKNGGPEAVFNAALSGTRDGATTLRAVMQSIPKDAQRSVTAAVVRRMGMPNPGQAGVDAAEQFSSRTFLTNWSKMSPEARSALFNRHGSDFSRNMDRIARVADNLDQGAGFYRNPSGTANRAAAMTYGASLVGGLFTGTLALPVAAGVTANILARATVNPKVVASLARATELPVSGIPSTIRELHKIAEEDGDDSAAELADLLQSQLPQQ